MEIVVTSTDDLKQIMTDCLADYFKNNPQIKEADLPDTNKLITQKELSNILRVTEQTLIRWKKQKKIPYIMIGSAPRFNLNYVYKALEKEKILRFKSDGL